jgi:hypothetical protein
MLHIETMSESRTPPRARTVLRAAICDEHWEAGDGVLRFHDTSPKDGACIM